MMKLIKLLPIVTVLLSSCTVSPLWHENDSKIEPKYKKFRARVTYYSAYEDKWGARVSDPNTKRATKGVTVAAHPTFKFGTEVHIPTLKDRIGDGKFLVQDRGSAVTKKKASGGSHYVFDVFVATNSEIRRLCKTLPEYMDVYVLEK